MTIRKLTFFLALALAAFAASAQTTDREGVTTSTDPARAAEVERHAQALQQERRMQPQAKAASARHAQLHHHRAGHRHHARRGAHKKAMT